ncbi:MAG: metalloregulator ArsR/SmtB family transcription factor [Actinobacteria bacterium]|nr:metalloregulator ArsR/SmtB family transcription factor [Actinomycetota bacterium]
MRQEFEVVEEGSVRGSERGESVREERSARLVALGRAFSDPTRVRMLGLMAEATVTGRSCCDLPERGVPAAEDENIGICVCEFEDYFGMGQSKVSYHVRKLKEAGLVYEEKRGTWSFYSLDREAVRGLLGEAAEYLGVAAVSSEKV